MEKLERLASRFEEFYKGIDISLLLICMIIALFKNIDLLYRIFSIIAQVIASAFLFYRFDRSNEKVKYYYKIGLILCDSLNVIGSNFENRVLFYLICLITFVFKIIGNGKANYEPFITDIDIKCIPIDHDEYYEIEKIEQKEEELEATIPED